MKLLLRSGVLASACALALTTTPAPAPAADSQLTAEVASSVKPPFEQFVKIYESKHKGSTIAAKYLGGGVIQADVEADTPIDIVVVGKNQTDKLTAHINAPVAVLTNREVLIVRRGNPAKITGLKDLAKPGVKVGMANGAGSAVGTLARAVLKKGADDPALGADFPVKVRQNSPAYFEKLQSEEEVIAGLEKGEADVAIGFVSSVDPSKFQAIPIPPQYNVDSVYYIFIPKSAKNATAAQDMVALMSSKQGQTILHSHRYLPPPK